MIVHDYGPGRVFVSLHAEVMADANLRDVHEIIDSAEKYLSDRFNCSATIHADPIITDDPETARLRAIVLEAIHTVDARLSMHDFRVVLSPSGKTLLFDVAIPFSDPSSDSVLVERIESEIVRMAPECRAVVTTDRTDN